MNPNLDALGKPCEFHGPFDRLRANGFDLQLGAGVVLSGFPGPS